MTPLEAIEACTARAPIALRSKMVPKSGQAKVGYDADVLALKGNPLTDIELLAEAENVNHAWKAGKLHKAPGMKMWKTPTRRLLSGDLLANWEQLQSGICVVCLDA